MKKSKSYIKEIAHPQVVYTTPLDSLRDFLLAGEEQILRQFAEMAGAIHEPGFYTFIPGAGPLLLVAHVDTVRSRQLKPKDLVFKHGVYSTADQNPLGADDRAGVYAIHTLVKMLPAAERPHILLTDGEESGGYGVDRFIKDQVLDSYTGDLNMLIEFDRMGADEAVTYSGDLPDYIATYLEDRGWRTGHGSYTDIASLIDVYKVPGVNLSVGYYNQHTGAETLVVDLLEMTISRALKIIKDPPTEKHIQEDDVWYGSWYGMSEREGGDDRWREIWEQDKDEDPQLEDVQWALDAIETTCNVCMEDWHQCSCGSVADQLYAILWDDELQVLIEQHPKMQGDSTTALDLIDVLTAGAPRREMV